MLALAVGLLLLGTPVLSEGDLRVVERLAWRAGVPRGAVESLSTDVTGDGSPDVVLLTRTAGRLVLFVAEGPVSPVGRWWRVDLHRGTGAGELCVPVTAAWLTWRSATPSIPRSANRRSAARISASSPLDGSDMRFAGSVISPRLIIRRD